MENPHRNNQQWFIQKWNNTKNIHSDAYKWIIEVPAQFAWVIDYPFEVFQSSNNGQFVYVNSYTSLEEVKKVYEF